ncbi:MAG: Ig-like domain-containing protein [Williamsia sp.]|nr:Ig-like domain-containing protein [Williamsia sp.]
MKLRFFFSILLSTQLACNKGSDPAPQPPPVPASFSFNSLQVNGAYNGYTYYNVDPLPVIKFSFSAPVDHTSATNNLTWRDNAGASVSLKTSFENNDSTVVLQPQSPLKWITQYTLAVPATLQSKKGGALQTAISISLTTAIDSSDKFPRISDNALLDLVQSQTFKYFWDFGHPVSGLARERNTSGDIVTSGGSGFGLMALVVAVNRQFITRADGLARLQKIVDFLKNKAQRFHGAYPHWINGSTGAVQPFSTKDDGADLVETSYLFQGLLAVRQYFNGTDAAETALRADINNLWNAVEWDWFRKNGENLLYWHWSPNYNWDMNMPIRGWNEALITYVLAASSPTHAISKDVYANGWAQNGAMKNGNLFYNYKLPLGPAYGGPLFFAHYSFLGINPNGLLDAYADYGEQNLTHTKINYEYCRANPKGYFGYSGQCWGLTASDIPNGYTASSPANDVGVIAPTAALSSFPYTPAQSMNALKFFYYKLGDKLWKEYGFVDAFSLKDTWFASSFLAIDQGPIIVMIENYRSNLLWNLFMSCPEVKGGLRNLGFQGPDL